MHERIIDTVYTICTYCTQQDVALAAGFASPLKRLNGATSSFGECATVLRATPEVRW